MFKLILPLQYLFLNFLKFLCIFFSYHQRSILFQILLTFFDHDKKRLHFRLEMIEKKSKKLSSTIEMLSLHVDLNKRKVAEFDQQRTKIMDSFISENNAKFKNENLKFIGKLKK